MMEIDQSAIDLAKRIIDLEAQCEQLKEDNNNLVEQLMDLKDKEKNTNDKYVKWKNKSVELKEKLDLEGGKWKEELEKSLNNYRKLEVEKRQIQIDFMVAQNGDEGSEKLRAEVERLKVLLQEAQGRITTLVEQHNSLEAKLVMEAKKQKMKEDKKIFELCQMIQELESKKGGTGRSFNVQEVIKSEKKNTKQSRKKKITELVEQTEREKSEEIDRILNENMALKEEHKKKTLDLVLRVGVLEREKRKLETESRKKDEKIMKLVEEKEQLAAKKQKMEMYKPRVVISEGAFQLQHLVHPTSNLAILDTPTPSINQGEKSAILPHSDEHQGSFTYGATKSIDSKNEVNTMTTSANGSMRKRASPESLSGGDRSTS